MTFDLPGGLIPSYAIIEAGAFVLVIVIGAGLAAAVRRGSLEFPRRQVAGMMRGLGDGVKVSGNDLLAGLGRVLAVQVIGASVLRTCDFTKWAAHLSVFWGFVFTGISTTLALLTKPEGSILPLAHPVKIFGNIGGVLLVVGCAVMFKVRYQQSGSVWHLNRSDFFVLVLLFTALTGFATQQAIYAYGRSETVTALSYWIHLIIVTVLLATAPFSKFVHAIYKPTWLLSEQLEARLLSKRGLREIGPFMRGVVKSPDSGE